MRRWLGALGLAGAVIGVGCSGGGTSRERPAASQPSAAPPPTAAAASPSASPSAPGKDHLQPALLNPSLANDEAPARFRVRFQTTRGVFVVEVVRRWAPRGADRFYNLVKCGFYDDAAFFRVLDGFVAQFGIHGNPRVSEAWRDTAIPDDPVVQSNTRGTLTFATAGPGTRTTQLFINFRDNSSLDRMGFSPFGRVVEGMEVVDRLYSGYGEGAPQGRGPSQARIEAEGNAYLRSGFGKLDFVRKAVLLKG